MRIILTAFIVLLAGVAPAAAEPTMMFNAFMQAAIAVGGNPWAIAAIGSKVVETAVNLAIAVGIPHSPKRILRRGP